jgi:peroxiredoxin
MKHRIRWIAATIAVIALAAGIALAIWDRTPASADALLALSLPDTKGTQQPLGQWRGKVIVVNFWATWCEPCREEMPEFVREQQELGPRGLQFVGIAVDQPEKVDRFVKELRLNYPALIGGYDAVELSAGMGNRLAALPFTIVIDRQGRVVQTHLGPVKKEQFRASLQELL